MAQIYTRKWVAELKLEFVSWWFCH